MMMSSVTTHKARKLHDCWWCSERIEPGTKYIRWVWKDGKSLDTVKCHPECKDAWDSLEYGEDEVSFGSFCRGCTCERGACECEKGETDGTENLLSRDGRTEAELSDRGHVGAKWGALVPEDTVARLWSRD